MSESCGIGPLYGVELIKSLPISGGMKQAMPNWRDLERVAEVSQRGCAGYEILLSHFRNSQRALREARDALRALGVATRTLQAVGNAIVELD